MSELLLARTCRKGRLEVVHGDITKIAGDAIVTTANNRLSGREGLDVEIHRAAGSGLMEACQEIARVQRARNLPPCVVGQAVVTEAFDLQAEHVIHVVGPDCRRPNQDAARRELLDEAYNALFTELRGLPDVRRVIAPPISMGIFAYPHREGARITLETLLAWLDGPQDPGVVDVYVLVVKEPNFISNMRTIYRETEDQLPGYDSTFE